MIKIGIIGMGIRGTMYANTIAQNPNASLVACTEFNDQMRTDLSQKYQVPFFKEFTDMLDTIPMDAVIVATPDHLHHDAVVYAANKCVNILCEKPFSTDVNECIQMSEAVKKNGVKCMVAFENRWNSPVVAAINQINSGKIGEVVNINARLNDTIFVPTEMLRWAKGTSVGWFLFPHMLDLICWMSNKKVESVYAVGTKKKLVSMGFDLYDTIQTVLNFEDGTHSTISSSWILPNSMPLIYDFKMEIIGSDGALYLDTNDQMIRMGADRFSHVHTLGTEIDGFATGGANFMLHHFVNVLVKNELPQANEDVGSLNTKVVSAIHESIISGQVIKIN